MTPLDLVARGIAAALDALTILDAGLNLWRQVRRWLR
jgi:hypothetical protein